MGKATSGDNRNNRSQSKNAKSSSSSNVQKKKSRSVSKKRSVRDSTVSAISIQQTDRSQDELQIVTSDEEGDDVGKKKNNATRHVSDVHKYAKKVSNTEYECLECSKVRSSR